MLHYIVFLDLTLIKLIITCFEGTRIFLIRYSGGHMK